jgi:hypothetical protein
VTGDLSGDKRDIHELLVTLWSKAIDQPGYNKADWILLQQAVFNLMAKTPPDPLEPPRWDGETVEIRPEDLEGYEP